jgi:glyoxylase-like metal-dependent hydrolase (beta-lactamase superfamily II)
MELVEVAPSVHACLQPDLGLGYSNSGLVVSGGGLVIDSFWDLPRTRRLIEHYSTVLPSAPQRLVNTHHNGDHCWGNQLFADLGTEIIGHRLCAAYLAGDVHPEMLVSLAATPDDELGALAGFAEAMRHFDFEGIVLTPPGTTIEGDTEIDLDGVLVQLLYVGPAHTPGDVVVWVPEQGVLFTGDVLFHECTPIGWEGTYENWIGALARLEALEPAVVVPGHGPLATVDGLRGMREYLEYVYAEARGCFDAGLAPLDAAKQIELGPYLGWTEPERLAFQVDRAYREFRGEAWDAPIDVMRLLAEVAELRLHLAEA